MRPRDHKENKQTTNHLYEHTDIKILEIYFYYFTPCVYRFVCVSIECPWSRGPLELELQAVVSCLMWMLGLEFGFSTAIEHAFND